MLLGGFDMKNDLILKAIKRAKFIWREAKKPVMRIRSSGKVMLLPEKNESEEGKPKLTYNAELDFTLVYLLLGFMAMGCLLRAVMSLFTW